MWDYDTVSLYPNLSCEKEAYGSVAYMITLQYWCVQRRDIRRGSRVPVLLYIKAGRTD